MRAWEEEKNTQEIEDERWARLDKRFDRARARHELGLGESCFLIQKHRYVNYFIHNMSVRTTESYAHGRIPQVDAGWGDAF